MADAADHASDDEDLYGTVMPLRSDGGIRTVCVYAFSASVPCYAPSETPRSNLGQFSSSHPSDVTVCVTAESMQAGGGKCLK